MKINIANLLTLTRVILVIPLAVLVFLPHPPFLLIAFLIALSYLSDSIDGTIAHKLNQVTVFGAKFDIYADRINDICLYIIFCASGVLPPVLGVLMVVRFLVTDAIRDYLSLQDHQTPFDLTKNKFGDFFISTRWSRAVNGGLKMFTFIFALAALYTESVNSPYAPVLRQATLAIGWASVIFNIFRGLPVIIQGKGLFFSGK